MKFTKLISMCFQLILIPVLLMGCMSKPIMNENEEDIKDLIQGTIEHRYIVNTTYYQILDLSPKEHPHSAYYYRIFSHNKVFAEDTTKRDPVIKHIDAHHNVIKLFQTYGSNVHTAQYFDVHEEKSSRVFSIYSNHAEYVDYYTKECLLAYFESPRDYGENVLLIVDIFDEQGFSIEISKNFFQAGCNRLVFLNESEIYIEYTVLAEGYSGDDVVAGKHVEFETIREVIKFR